MKILKLRYIVLLIACMLAITACSSNDTLDAEQSEQTQQNIQQNDQEQSGEDNESSHGELLFQDERVSIYAADKKAYTVTLVYGDYTQRLEEFNSLRPHCTTWEMDADDDGTNELYLIHTFGSGTGVSVQKLFVFEPNGDGLDVYCHDSKEIQAQFNASCKGIYHPEQHSLQLSYGESSYICIVDDRIYRNYMPLATKTALISGEQIHYTPTEDDTIQLSFKLSFRAEGIAFSLSYLPEDSTVSCLIRFSGTGFEVVEDLKFTYASEHLWIAPEFNAADSLGYEEFFAQERVYHDPDAPWYGYIHAGNSVWFAGDGELRALYGLGSDEDGFYIYKDLRVPYFRITNTQDLSDCSAVITNTRQLYCAVDGKLFRVDVLSGERDPLYSAEYIPDMVLCHNDVLYFLAISDGILSLNRLYLPTMTLDVLYAQTAPEVPVSCYELYAPGSNRSTITWETINPTFWKAVTEILEDPESEYPELYYPALTPEYLATHSIHTETVQHNFALLQDVTGLRPRMKCYYDPVADTYEERYGIYDICFFGTGIHGDDEHFESYPEYRK